MVRFSVIIPVYNRPEEMDELLESLSLQTWSDFEVIVVEDGSQRDCQEVVEKIPFQTPGLLFQNSQ